MKNSEQPILIALGANLPSQFGEPKETLIKAKEAIQKVGIKIIKESKLYLTAPVPVSDDPWYHNEVIAVETDFSSTELLEALNKIETDFCRVRSVKNAPRLLDLDIVAYQDEVIESDSLTVPHPRMHERAFVLYPLRDVAPDWQHPKVHRYIDVLIAELSSNQEIKVCE